MTTGTLRSGSICAVFALKALQNSMMLTPCWPSAGPIGGAGFAFPAGTCSLIYAVIFFAILGLSRAGPPVKAGFKLSPFHLSGDEAGACFGLKPGPHRMINYSSSEKV